MSKRTRIYSNREEESLFGGYKPHYELWTVTSDEGAPQPESEPGAPGRSAPRVLMETKARREIPPQLVYWTLCLALGAMLLGLTTRPTGSPAQAPGMQIVGAEAPSVVPVATEVPSTFTDNEPYFVIVLDPIRERRHVPARQLEAQLKEKLTRNGFPNIGVSVSREGAVFLAGTLFDHSEKGEITSLVRKTPGVTEIHFSDVEVRKLYGPAYLGAETAATSGDGVRVTKVYNGSPAEMAGIRPGDVIVKFGDHAVSDPQSFRYMVMSRVGGQRVPVTITRDGQERTVTVRLGELPALASE